MRFADCNITKITPSGEVTIKTNEPVVVRDSWQTEKLGPEIFDVYFVKYSNERNNLLDFEIVGFKATEIKVQLNFA